MINVSVYSLTGKTKEKIILPQVFNAVYRPDLIQRAVVSLQSKRRQPYGVSLVAGMQTSADYFGNRRHTYRITINRGMSRLPREKPGGGGLGRVRIVPQSRGGRGAHPPKNKDYSKKINKKEYNLALGSAITATTNKELVADRGHKIEKVVEIPLVVEDSIEKINKTKEILAVFDKLGLTDDLEKARCRKIRAGRGKTRGRKYKTKKSILLIINEDRGIKSATKNIPGVDTVIVDELNVEHLAPGTHVGRLTVWIKSAIKKIGEKENKQDGPT